ncbi:MAG: CopG family transcriptional regulator [Thermoleophilaceae bacterium]|nr:CopG family transcriptional regulator [Thermoleophilaceae bacterium]
MKRTTVSLPDDVAITLSREARRRGVSASEIAREALADHLGMNGTAKPREIPFAGLFRSSGEHWGTAADIEEIIKRDWTDDLLRGG